MLACAGEYTKRLPLLIEATDAEQQDDRGGEKGVDARPGVVVHFLVLRLPGSFLEIIQLSAAVFGMLKRIFLIKETRNSPQNRKHTVRTSAPSPQWQENVRSYVPVLPNNAGLSRRSHPRMSSTLSAAASPDPHFHGKSTFRSHQTTDRSFRPDAVLLTS